MLGLVQGTLHDGLVEAVRELLEVPKHAEVWVAAPGRALRRVGRQDGALNPAVDGAVHLGDLRLSLLHLHAWVLGHHDTLVRDQLALAIQRQGARLEAQILHPACAVLGRSLVVTLHEAHSRTRGAHAHRPVPCLHAVGLEHDLVDLLGRAVQVDRAVLVGQQVAEGGRVDHTSMLGQLFPLALLAVGRLLTDGVRPLTRDALDALGEGGERLTHFAATGHDAQRIHEAREQGQRQQAHVLVNDGPAVDLADALTDVVAERPLHTAHGVGHVTVLALDPLLAGLLILQVASGQHLPGGVLQLASGVLQHAAQELPLAAEARGVFRRMHALAHVAAQGLDDVLLLELRAVLRRQEAQHTFLAAGEPRAQHTVLALRGELCIIQGIDPGDVVGNGGGQLRHRDGLCVGATLGVDGVGHRLHLPPVLASCQKLVELALSHLVDVPDHREVALVDLADAQTLLVRQIAVKALEQNMQLLLGCLHVRVAQLVRGGLPLHRLGQLGELVRVQPVDGFAEQVVVAAHLLVALVQVASPLVRRTALARVRKEHLGNPAYGRAGALRQDGVRRQHHGSHTLGDGVDTARTLRCPRALVEGLGQGACPC